MKNSFKQRRSGTFNVVQKSGLRLPEVRLIVIVLLLILGVSGVAFESVSRAQDSYIPSKVFKVSAQPSAGGSLVSIASDTPLGRAQNWQDSEGYHLVFPNTVSAESLKAAPGVRVRRVGTSLEVLLQTKPGSRVSLQPDGNHVYLVIDSKLEARAMDGDSRFESNASQEGQAYSQQSQQTNSTSSSAEPNHTAGNWSPPIGSASDLPPEPFPRQTANGSPDDSASQVESEDEGLAASVFSGTTVVVVMALGIFGLIVSRKIRLRQPPVHTAESSLSDDLGWDDDLSPETFPEMRGSPKSDPGSSLVKSGGAGSSNGSSRQAAVVRVPVAGPTSLYGAYRIDQEVGKLILGQPHRMDVLSSRAADDRRAIETSLIKSLNSFDQDESARRRARTALEEYGFVARQCAALLLSPDPFDRTSAARCLGEIKSEAALPFLLEGLYDPESIVRNQAVVSIGELKVPSAIGALLDIARTHADVPSALLSRTLSACSVEGLDFFDAMIPEAGQLGGRHDLSIVEQITHLEPSSSVEELPASCDDEKLAQALSLLESRDVQERSEALKTMAQYRVQSCVQAVAHVARHDSEPNIRSMAVASLGLIDHECVFPFILIGMADATREVRASAARALNRLSFDRADAYVRVIENSDETTLNEVALACIQAGIVSQNINRLDSSDHRQAYETFSLICLLAKANMYEPILDAIADHSNLDGSLKAIHLLASTGQPGTFEQLRQLAVREGVREEVKTALLKAMYKLDQIKSSEAESTEATEGDTAPKPAKSEAGDAVSKPGSAIAFDFASASDIEDSNESDAEGELNLDELEL
jgi:HEAT repeat protein